MKRAVLLPVIPSVSDGHPVRPPPPFRAVVWRRRRVTHGESDEFEGSPQDLEGLLSSGRPALVRVNQQRLSLVVLLNVRVRAVVRQAQNTATQIENQLLLGTDTNDGQVDSQGITFRQRQTGTQSASLTYEQSARDTL